MGRKKLDRSYIHVRVSPATPDKLKQIALLMGFTYADEGSIGQLLDAIAEAKIDLKPK